MERGCHLKLQHVGLLSLRPNVCEWIPRKIARTSTITFYSTQSTALRCNAYVFKTKRYFENYNRLMSNYFVLSTIEEAWWSSFDKSIYKFTIHSTIIIIVEVIEIRWKIYTVYTGNLLLIT